jgi:hypothetical protein
MNQVSRDAAVAIRNVLLRKSKGRLVDTCLPAYDEYQYLSVKVTLSKKPLRLVIGRRGRPTMPIMSRWKMGKYLSSGLAGLDPDAFLP